MKTLHAICILLTALSLSACDGGFDEESLIKSLRILGIKADNPRLWLDESATLEALIASEEEDDEALTYLWEVCPFFGPADEGYPCIYPEESGDLFKSLNGEEETYTFKYEMPIPMLVDTFCSQTEELKDELPEGTPVPSCTQGYPLPIKLTVTNQAGETRMGLKNLYLAPTSGDFEPEDNENPVVLSLGPAEDAPEAVQEGEDFPLQLVVDTSALETFFRLSSESLEIEDLVISWFARNAGIDSEKTFFRESYGADDESLKVTIQPDGPGTTTVWAVIRDGRGGIDWIRYDLEVK